jgi:hypothetical protein
MHLDLLQYTVSNFGNRRGFRLEYSIDQGQTWVLIRNERGNSVSDTINSTSLESLTNSPKGTVWEDQISLDDAMIRFTRSSVNSQIFRLHDLRIYGIGLFEDMNDAAFETNSGIAWSDWMSTEQARHENMSIKYSNGILNYSDIPVWSRVMNLYGKTLRSYSDEQVINLTDLVEGVYMVQVCGKDGKTLTEKIIQ